VLKADAPAPKARRQRTAASATAIARRPGPGQAPGVKDSQAWAMLFLPRRVPGAGGTEFRAFSRLLQQ
jgi:hypothetical protein